MNSDCITDLPQESEKYKTAKNIMIILRLDQEFVGVQVQNSVFWIRFRLVLTHLLSRNYPIKLDNYI